MILIFDLDDTLYSELEYVKSGLTEVSKHLSSEFKIDPASIYNDMFNDLVNNGRGLVFNNILNKHRTFTIKNLYKCISVYRSHNPKINLYPEAVDCLEELKDFNKYIVTDGNIIVQRKKIAALNIKKTFKKTIPTYQYGLNYSKPSTLCFEKIMNWEKCDASNMIYIGDNPKKDFVNIKRLGIKTIRVLTGGYKNLKLSQKFEAEITIKTLGELTIKLIEKIQNENK